MLTKLRYSPRDLLLWTRRELGLFAVYALVIAVGHIVYRLDFLRVPWAPIGVLGTAVAFIVGFQNNAAYERIWEARKIWGGIVNSSRMWAISVLDFVNADRGEHALSNDEVRLQHTRLIHRHVAWLTALRYEMRTPRSWEEFENHATNREWSRAIHIPEREFAVEEEIGQFLSADECDEVCGRNNRAAAILALQSRHLASLARDGLLWEFAHLELQSLIKDLITFQGQSERIKNFPYPRQYATLSFQFVRLFVFLLPFAVVPEFVGVGRELAATTPAAAQIFPWISVPFCVIVSWVFHTMERIGRVGENPFEGSANDVPISTIARGIEIDLRQMLREDADALPGPIPSQRDVQM